MGIHPYIFSFLAMMLLIQTGYARQLDDFSSDGCSQFPDGTLSQQDLWCDCCVAHDMAYWQGGNRKQKKRADEALRSCILKKTGNTVLANTMYLGVTVGGSPVYPTWYRWGYGWRYGRGFQSLNQYESRLVKQKIQNYRRNHAHPDCDAEHPVSLKIRQQWQKFFNKP